MGGVTEGRHTIINGANGGEGSELSRIMSNATVMAHESYRDGATMTKGDLANVYRDRIETLQQELSNLSHDFDGMDILGKLFSSYHKPNINTKMVSSNGEELVFNKETF